MSTLLKIEHLISEAKYAHDQIERNRAIQPPWNHDVVYELRSSVSATVHIITTKA